MIDPKGVRSPLATRLARGVALVAVVLATGMAGAGCSGPTATVEPAAPAAVDEPPAEPISDVDAPDVTVDATAPTAPQATRRAPTVIAGHVQDPDGEPIVDAAVILAAGSVPVPEMAIFTDATGRYAWPVSAGTFTVEVYRDGYTTQQADVTVADGEAVALDFTLEPK